MQTSELEELVAPELEALGFECVKLEVAGNARHPVVRLFIDKPGGVTIGDCTRVTRAIGLVLDARDPFPERYLLEVSSPGSNRPLTTREHFQRFAGQDAKVQTRARADGEKRTYTGCIRSCINDVLTLDTDDGEVHIPLDDVAAANLIHQEYKIDKKRSKGDKRSGRGVKRRGDDR